MTLTERIPTKVKSGSQDKTVLNMLEVITDNQLAYTNRANNLHKLKEMKKDLFEINKKSTNGWTSSLQSIQIIDSVWQQLQRPSVSYSSDTATDEESQIVRDGVKTAQEMGGFTDVLSNKPSQFYEALAFGDGFMRIGIDETKEYKITFDNVQPDAIFVDSNASVMHTRNSARSVTRAVLIYSYDFDNAKQLYPDATFGLGEIPRTKQVGVDFNKTLAQDAQAKKREVEIAHYFDIGGKKPVYLICAGDKTTIIDKLEGDSYPFRNRHGNPVMPLGQMRGAIDSDEGFFNAGYLLVLYKHIIARQELFNKRFGKGIRSLSDIKFLNATNLKAGTVLKRIRDAKRMMANGDEGFVINDSKDPVSIEQMEKSLAGDNEMIALEQAFDQEIKRMGINLDGIRQGTSATAAQILTEKEVSQAAPQQIINKNTEYFKFVEEMTMNLIREFVDDNDQTPIRTVVKETVRVQPETEGETPQFEDIEMKGVTLGDVKQLLNKHSFFIEVNTQSGVRNQQSTKILRALALGQVAGSDPAIAKFIGEEFAAANNTKLPEVPQTPQTPQGGQRGIPQAGIQGAIEQLQTPPKL